jgi:uncharacterized protein YecE (DUF72 family)
MDKPDTTVDESGGERGTAPVRFGTSSFSSKDWLGSFYPRGTKPADFLARYAERYDTVEIDATYYAVPAPRVVEGWERKVPDGFLVAAKFPREIVHGGEGSRPDAARVLTPDASYPVRDEFLRVMRRLGPKLGPLVIQLPFFRRSEFPGRADFLHRLDRFLGDLPEDLHFAVEVRNREWLNDELAELCRHHRTALVLVDRAHMPHADELGFDPVTAGFAYIRLLGDRHAIERITTTWDREVIDHGERLARWAAVLTRLLEREVPAFVYVNNHYAGHAPATVERLRNAFLDAAREAGLDPARRLAGSPPQGPS